MNFIKGLPRGKFAYNHLAKVQLLNLNIDNWEWAQVVNRAIFGIGICSLGFFGIGSSAPVFNGEGNMTKSLIWRIVLGGGHAL